MLESLLCNSCGAPLEVPSSANYVQCIHCRTNLKVHRSSGAITTETIEELKQATGNLKEQVDELTRQNKLANLEREWESRRESFMIRDKEGRPVLPATGHAVLSGVAVAFFGCIWIVFAISITSGMPNQGAFSAAKVLFPLFGIGFIAFGVIRSAMMHQQASEYQRAERQYRQLRSKITQGDD